ncbi:MAG: transcriptional regulator [Thermoprotei archaeon]|nr:MAG: transcriptional regulator [Thermoprotei archaeon]
MSLDEKDKKIISILLENARLPFTDIAKKLGITDVAVKKRLKKLEKNGVIKKYTVIVDPSKLGYQDVALVGVDTEPDKILEVAEKLSEKEYSRFVYLTTGDHMIMVEIWAKNNTDLMKIIKEIGSLPGVKKVCPAIILDQIK